MEIKIANIDDPWPRIEGVLTEAFDIIQSACQDHVNTLGDPRLRRWGFAPILASEAAERCLDYSEEPKDFTMIYKSPAEVQAAGINHPNYPVVLIGYRFLFQGEHHGAFIFCKPL